MVSVMRGRAKIRVLVSIAGLAIGVGAGVALPRVAHELPDPLAVAARWPERLWTRFLPPRMSLAALTRPEREATSALARTLDGLVVWSSNRSGNHELYLLYLRKQTVRQLTHHPRRLLLALLAGRPGGPLPPEPARVGELPGGGGVGRHARQCRRDG
jgi:hypothetical protein